MIIWLTEVKTQNKVAINPKYIVGIFEIADEGEFKGCTAVSLINGSVIVEQTPLYVADLISQGD